MGVNYFSSSNQPVFKSSIGYSPSTTLAVWTPATGKSIVLTDIALSSAAAGTIRFWFTTDTTVPTSNRNFLEFIQGGSVVIDRHFETPVLGTANESIYVVSGANGSELSITLCGFEMD